MLNRHLLQLPAAFLLAVLSLSVTGPARAASPAEIAAGVPVEIPQILTGGFWEEGDNSGIYRVIVVTAGSGENLFIEVFIQWLKIEENGPKPEIIKTIPLNEVNEKKFGNAFVFLQGGKEEDEVILVVSSYNPETDNEQQVWIEVGTPGNYKMVAPQNPDAASDKE